MEKMGKAGRKKAEQFDIKRHVKKIEKVYRETIKSLK